MRIAYVTTYDASDMVQWSGLGHYIAKSLVDQSIAVEYIGGLTERWSLFFKAKQFAYLKLARNRHLRDREPTILKSYAKQVAEKLKYTDASIVFSPGAIPISYLE